MSAGDGAGLGPVRRTRAGVLGLLRAEPTSYLSSEPDREPTPPATGPGFGLTDLLALTDGPPAKDTRS